MSDPDTKAYGESWYAATMVDAAPRPPLAFDLDVDVCVIGGGLAGLTTAREVARSGWSVVLLEAGRLAQGASGRNTGFVLPGFGADADKLIARVGFERTKDLWALSQAGLDYVRNAIRANGATGVDPQNGWLYVSKTDNSDEFREVCRAARRIGLRDRGLADRAGARGAAQRALLLRHQLPAGVDHPSAELCAGAGRRRRTRRRADFRKYPGYLARSDGRAQAHRYPGRAAARQPRRAVRQCATRNADAARCRHAGSGHHLCDHHRAARRAPCRSDRLSRRRQRYRSCRQSLPHCRRRPPDVVGPLDGVGARSAPLRQAS